MQERNFVGIVSFCYTTTFRKLLGESVCIIKPSSSFRCKGVQILGLQHVRVYTRVQVHARVRRENMLQN